MVNMQPEGHGEPQWYPQLPEGFEEQPIQRMQNQNMSGWQQDMGMQGYGSPDWSQGQGMPFAQQEATMSSFGQPWGDPYGPQAMAPNFGLPGFGPPGQGMPGFGPPGFGPPGQGTPGFGPPGFGPPGQGTPGFGPPGFGPPGQGGPPGQQQGQQGQQGPSSPPPNFAPPYPASNNAQLFRVDPGAIRGCLYRYTYVWTSRRNGFWFYPTFVGRSSVAGFRWRSRQRRWEYFGIDLDRIDQFTCF